MDKIPVNIISGFLGSGKTTAIINLLSLKEEEGEWAVIINEFGKISIDSQTMRSSSQNSVTLYDISGGCICCSAKGYFQEHLDEISGSGKFTRIIIEPSGLGGIDMVSEIVQHSANLTLMPVICLADITAIEIPRLHLLPIYRTQISKADIIAFSKCDLVADPMELIRLTEQFRTWFPDKQKCLILSEDDLLPVVLDPQNIQNTSEIKSEVKKGNFHMELLPQVPPNGAEDRLLLYRADRQELKDDNYLQMNYRFEKNTIFDDVLLTRLFRDYPEIVRAKGHIQTKAGWNLFNLTLSGIDFKPCGKKDDQEVIIIAVKSHSGNSESFYKKLETTMVSKIKPI